MLAKVSGSSGQSKNNSLVNDISINSQLLSIEIRLTRAVAVVVVVVVDRLHFSGSSSEKRREEESTSSLSGSVCVPFSLFVCASTAIFVF